jgi:hypothetical protein
MANAGKTLTSAPLTFGGDEWREEVGRLDSRSAARIEAERARRDIEGGEAALTFQKCEADGADGTRLPGCVKLYVPLGAQGASEAPFGFVFQLAQNPDGSLVWNFLAFGERHPDNPRTRTVYERAHKRLHGRYPR